MTSSSLSQGLIKAFRVKSSDSLYFYLHLFQISHHVLGIQDSVSCIKNGKAWQKSNILSPTLITFNHRRERTEKTLLCVGSGKRYAEVLVPSACDSDLTGKSDIKEVTKLRWDHTGLEWAPNPMTPVRKPDRRYRQGTHRSTATCWQRQRPEWYSGQSRTAGSWWSPTQAGERQGKILLQSLQKPSLLTPVSQT